MEVHNTQAKVHSISVNVHFIIFLFEYLLRAGNLELFHQQIRGLQDESLVQNHLLMNWLSISLMLCILSISSCTSQPSQKMNSQQFPTLPAELLSGEKVVFPDFVKGKKVVIALVFEKWAQYQKPQFQADKWKAFWEAELQEKGVDFYEIPMMSGVYVPISGWANSGMRSGIPKKFHSRVACFYGNKMKYAQRLQIEDITDCYVCVIDEEGIILDKVYGEIDSKKKQRLMEAIQ